jgi:hypothetical protein
VNIYSNMLITVPVIAVLLSSHYRFFGSEGKLVTKLASWMQATASLIAALTVVINTFLQKQILWTMRLYRKIFDLQAVFFPKYRR